MGREEDEDGVDVPLSYDLAFPFSFCFAKTTELTTFERRKKERKKEKYKKKRREKKRREKQRRREEKRKEIKTIKEKRIIIKIKWCTIIFDFVAFETLGSLVGVVVVLIIVIGILAF